MTASDPGRLTHDEAMKRVHEAGRQSGLWGAPVTANPYGGKPAMQHESFAWLVGHSIGATKVEIS